MNGLTEDLLQQISLVILKGIEIKIKSYEGPGYLSSDDVLKDICDIISKHIGIEVTDNWTWDFLIEDFEEGIKCFTKEPFYKFMDTIEYIALDYFDGSIVKDINKVFERCRFEYRLIMDKNNPWVIKNFKQK